MAIDITALREEYTIQGLHRADLAADPLIQFEHWFKQAIAAEILEPNAMCLATVLAGKPSSRILLLKEVDDRGFIFYTNYASRKAQQLAMHPHAAMTFPWLALQRQVQIEGRVEQISRDESMAYFKQRPIASQLGACASQQSQPIANRDALDAQYAAVAEEFAEQAVTMPESWGGYRLIPERMEFWQGGKARVHDRFVYQLEDDLQWQITRLQP